MKEENIRVLVIDPTSDGPVEKTIPNTLEALQELVGGYIEVVRTDFRTALIVDENGKIKGKPLCLTLLNGRGFEHLVGTVVAVGIDGEEFCSLDEEQIRNVATEYLLGGVMV